MNFVRFSSVNSEAALFTCPSPDTARLPISGPDLDFSFDPFLLYLPGTHSNIDRCGDSQQAGVIKRRLPPDFVLCFSFEYFVFLKISLFFSAFLVFLIAFFGVLIKISASFSYFSHPLIFFY
ncbi:hypothetical protein E2C01_098117 [Portunus trituberculatus]|uniref:Uncharacterized protein n=1 Tax=Portunus trituberculatus TaxID=210409 RepID=A0A5B7KBB9_PORTR|nr:hypothetical protein [Portunus trituberculatus]